MNQEEQGKKMNQLIAKCWSDEGFKQKLLADPAATLKAEGVALPAGLTLKAVENTDKVFHLVIPAKPTDLSDLSDSDLDSVAGGSCGGCVFSFPGGEGDSGYC
ncbi:MAG: NHLP leader peptide family RiPP precursor, partial [Actinomycetota bacterium]